MALADSLKKAASKVVNKLGGTVSMQYYSASAYDTTSGTITLSTNGDSVKGILQDINAREVNEQIQASDKRLILAALDLTSVPETNDRVVIGGVQHQVIRVITQEQANTAITYELILRA